MQYRQPSLLQVFVLILVPLIWVFATPGSCLSEQIVIDENSESGKVAGDFYCSPCYCPILDDADTIELAGRSLTAGELYRYFQSRGLTEVNRLSFQVDVDCDPDNTDSVSLTELSFKIQDAAQNIVTAADFGDDELLVDKSEITSFKPEAVIEVDLGYDFMKRFSPDSKDAVELEFKTPNGAAGVLPRIVLTSNMSSFSSENLIRILGFIGFWSFVFFIANLLSRQQVDGRLLEREKVTLTANAIGTTVARSANGR